LEQIHRLRGTAGIVLWVAALGLTALPNDATEQAPAPSAAVAPAGATTAPTPLDHPPLPRLTVAPVFPFEGSAQPVWVLIAVDPDGKVSRAAVEGNSPDPYARAALDAARQFVFDPAVKDGNPTASEYRTKFTFELRALRRVFPGSYDDLAPRIAAVLRERYPKLVPLPSVGGFMLVGEPETTRGNQVNSVVLVRVGRQGPASTWVVVSASAVLRPASRHICD
jgi:TonB family protein